MVVKIFIVRSGSKANLCWRFRLMVCFWRAGFHDFGVKAALQHVSHVGAVMRPMKSCFQVSFQMRLCVCWGFAAATASFFNWLVVWNMIFIFPYIGNVIIPTDELIFFQRGRSTTNQLNIEIHDDPRRVPLFFSGLNFWTMEMGKSRDLASLQWGRSCRFAHCEFSNVYHLVPSKELVLFTWLLFLGRSISYVLYLMFDTCDGIFVLIWCCWKKSLKPRAVRTGFEADIRR